MRATVFTIGHSTRTIPEFAALLHEAAVDLVIDIRSIRRSRANPQFNADALPAALAEYRIAYQPVPALGGLRHHPKGTPPSPNDYWQVAAFRNYADYATTDAFRAGLDELEQLAGKHRCAIMCAEAVWWRCHRRIVADYLLGDGFDVRHIMGPGKIEPATLTPSAKRQDNGTLVYPAGSLQN